MAKNKNRSDFEKFQNKPQAGTAVADPPNVIPVDEPDDKEVDEPTDTVPADDLPPVVDPPTDDAPDTSEGPTVVRPGVPSGAYQKLTQDAMKATTAAEQEMILASAHPKCTDAFGNKITDPALHYKSALTQGKQVPVVKLRADADPLLVRSKNLLERLLAGGLIVPGAYDAYNEAVTLASDLVNNLAEKPDAESGQGSSGGNSEVGGRES